MQHTQLTIDHPNQYTPEQVLMVCLANFHKHFTFTQVLLGNNIEGRPDIKGFQFVIPNDQNRPDGRHLPNGKPLPGGQIVNYFKTIKDAADGAVQFPYPTVSEWLVAYKNLIAARKISPQDITLVPLVQIQCGRKHFNTLMFYLNSTNDFNVLIIEPRENNKMILNDYPISHTITAIEDAFLSNQDVASINITNPKIGVQAIFDNTTCGAHHINFVEVLSQLSQEMLDTPQKIPGYLRDTFVARRNQDNHKIAVFVERVKRYAERVGQDALEEDLNMVPNLVVPKFLVQEADQEMQELASPAKKSEVYLPISDLISSSIIQEYLNQYYRVEQQRCDHAKIDLVKEEISRYFRIKRTKIGFFPIHTRQETASEIINLLDTLSNLDIETANVRAAKFLYCCYASLTDQHSQLRFFIESALVSMLDCACEFNSISTSARHHKDRQPSMKRLFNALLRLSPDDQIDYPEIYATLITINSTDNNFSAKFDPINKAGLNRLRQELFVQIRTKLLPARPSLSIEL